MRVQLLYSAPTMNVTPDGDPTRVMPLVEAGRIRPVVDATFPLERVADAHRRLEAPEHLGKVMLTVAHPDGR